MKILLLAAGNSSRFITCGYGPKIFLRVHEKPMYQAVVENIKHLFDGEVIMISRSEYQLNEKNTGFDKVISIDKTTEGAACTALLAKEYIDNDEELVILNSDQLFYADPMLLHLILKKEKPDGLIFTFIAHDRKWSYAKVKNGNVTEVAEKSPISPYATVGAYYYKTGKMFCKYAEQMIEKDIRTNNEFYLAPVYNEMIKDYGIVLPFMVEKMIGLGTPEDYERYKNG